MKVAIVGSREYPKLGEVEAYVRSLPRDTVIISGGARGVDSVAEKTARECGLPVKIYLAEWEKFGKSAGYHRNQQMVDAADAVVAFWNGISRGTKHSIEIAQAMNRPLLVHQPVEVGHGVTTQVTCYNWEDIYS